MKRALVGLCVVALFGCSKSAKTAPAVPPPHPAPKPVATAPKPQPPAPAPAVVSSSSPDAVLARLHQIDTEEIALATAAKTSAHAKTTKSLAAQIAEQRTKDDAAVVALAKKLKVNLVAPSSLNLAPADKKDCADIDHELTAARAAPATQFDHAFLSAIEDADKREAAMLHADAASSANADLKALATREDPALQAQEKLAERDMTQASPKKGHHK